jgi:signal transduction histidine kinase
VRPAIRQELSGELLLKYEAERCRLTRRRIKTACVLVIGIAPVYALTDYLLYPHLLGALLALRFATVVLGLTIWLAVRTPIGARHPDLLCLLLCVGLALLSTDIQVLLIGHSVPYYPASVLIIFGAALLLPWRPTQAVAPLLVLLGLYVGASLLHGPIESWPLFTRNLATIGASIGIALVSMGAGEVLRRREFLARVSVRQERKTKSQLATTLAEKSAQIESLNREIEDLLYVASHDLRAPLINVQGFSRELQMGLDHVRSRNGKSPELNAALADIDESLQFILTAVTRMDGLISSLLNVSRIATRTNATEQVDLNSVVEKLVDSFHYQLSEKGIELDVERLPIVTGDAVRLGQLFGNLIDNAIKYMGDSTERRIAVGVRGDNGERRFFVQDTGQGIPNDEREQVFRLFRRLANGDCPGEGIGLTMVRKIVEKHHGRIWIDSTPGAGATFWFTLQSALPAIEMGGLQ